jgi:hypothetical protein
MRIAKFLDHRIRSSWPEKIMSRDKHRARSECQGVNEFDFCSFDVTSYKGRGVCDLISELGVCQSSQHDLLSHAVVGGQGRASLASLVVMVKSKNFAVGFSRVEPTE